MVSARIARVSTQRARTATLAAPVGGWNARDSIGDMDKLDAVFLQNFFPGTSSVNLRKGYSQFATGITGQVESLMAYSSGTGDQFFAAAGESIYDVTDGGAISSSVVDDLTNARFQYVNTTTAGGSFMLCVNGEDMLQMYDGTTWTIDGDGSHDISGLDTSTVSNITVFKNRVWFIQNETLKAWYLGAAAISGAATALDMSAVCMQGGYLVAAMTWTLDAGYGVDDYLAFITSNGEVLVWRLTDPTTPSGIALIGIWNISPPVGRRCWLKFGGDLLIITQDGLVPMSGALQSSRTNPRVSLTDKIQAAMSEAVTNYGDNFGWQILSFPKQSQLYLNVPVAEGSTQQQYVMNTITRNWGNFVGWNANCWELFGDDPYFGGDGFVGKAWDTLADDGASVVGVALQAFYAWGGATQKQCKMIRYHLRSDGAPQIYGNVNVDYDTQDVSAQLASTPSDYGVWDAGDWDGAIWGSGLVPSSIWQGATGIGYTFAPFLKASANAIQLQWTATDLVFEAGGTI